MRPNPLIPRVRAVPILEPPRAVFVVAGRPTREGGATAHLSCTSRVLGKYPPRQRAPAVRTGAAEWTARSGRGDRQGALLRRDRLSHHREAPHEDIAGPAV